MGGWVGGRDVPARAIAMAEAIEPPDVSWVWKWMGRWVTSWMAWMRGAAARGLRRPAMSCIGRRGGWVGEWEGGGWNELL